MRKLYAMGEMLIDFTAQNEEGGDARFFEKNAGGAPANVAVCAARLGCRSAVVTKLGRDAFGKFLRETLAREGVDDAFVFETDEANTALAFVFLDGNGERDFLFYRNPSADMLLSEADVRAVPIQRGDILHFGSVDLADAPVRGAHRALIGKARSVGAIVSFDPNLRYPLWKSREELLETVRAFLPLADVVKVSEDELFDIAGETDEGRAVAKLFAGNAELVLVTKGERGAAAYTRSASAHASPESAHCVDATGAGDTFIGTVLSQLLRDGVAREELSNLGDRLLSYLAYANRAAAISVTRRGAIPSMPGFAQVFGGEKRQKKA